MTHTTVETIFKNVSHLVQRQLYQEPPLKMNYEPAHV